MTETGQVSTPAIRLKSLYIENFKAIDKLELIFSKPLMEADPDIVVLGSKNGVGKTSIMEALSCLYMLMVLAGQAQLEKRKDLFHYVPLETLIRSGEEEGVIEAVFEHGGKEIHIGVTLADQTGQNSFYSDNNEDANELVRLLSMVHTEEDVKRWTESILGNETEPLLIRNFIYFHSNRRVREGNVPMRTLVSEQKQSDRRTEASHFKMEILRAMMSQAGLFENLNIMDARERVDVINSLMGEFAKGSIGRLRTASDGTLEFRVNPENGGPPFSFDGLSSGQKEIISTLFLIWHHTKDNPSIVLIDEPELHLNAEWHRPFVQHLRKLAPHNQYILATHSEEIFASVDPEQRIFLRKDEEEGEKS